MFTIKDFGIKIKRSTLLNGSSVLLFQKKGMPIYTEIRLASGSRFDPPGKEGLAHFVEHMLVAGSKKFPSKDTMAIYIEQLGGVFGASVGPDSIGIAVEVAGKEDYSKSVLLLREMLTESLFDDKVIKTERKSIFREIGDKISNPSKYIWDLHAELFYQDTEVGKSNLGSKDSVRSISRKNLYTHYQNMIVSGRATTVVCGDIELEQVVKELETNLPLRISKKYNFGEILPVTRNKHILIYQYPNQEQVHMLIGFRTSGIKNHKTIPLSILSTIFGKGRASVLKKRLRYEKGLVYGAQTYTMNLSDAGTWTVKTSTSKEKLQEVMDIITEEFSRIASGGITDEELQFAKNKMTRSSRRQMQTAASWVKRHIRRELAGNSMLLPEYLNAINDVGKEDISQVGKEYFKPNSWYLAMCGDVDEASVKVNF